MIRVLMVPPRFWPDMGGVETHVYEVARRLDPARVEASVLTTDPSGTLPRTADVEGIGVTRERSYPRTKDFYASPGLFRRVLRDKHDLIHFQGVHTFVPIFGMLAAVLARRPFVLTFHTGGHSSATRSKLRDLQWTVLRPLLRRARLLIGVSRFEADYFRDLLGLPADRVVVIRNGGSLPEIGEVPEREPGETLLSVGRLVKYKGHHRVIAALPHLLRDHPDIRLSILGSGDYEDDLRKLAADLGVADRVTIEFIPGADRVEMARRMVSADIVTMLSDYEAHPIAVMEAVALGRPVLAANTSGCKELAEEGLIDAVELDASPEATAAAIHDLLVHPRPSRPALELPTWEACVARLHEVYDDAVAAVR